MNDDDGKLMQCLLTISMINVSCCAELVVAESVVVIKKLLQMQPEKHSDIIKHMAKLTDNIQVILTTSNTPVCYQWNVDIFL